MTIPYFTDNSYLSFPSPTNVNIRSVFVLDIRFKSDTANGLLFYVAHLLDGDDSGDFLSISIWRRYMKFVCKNKCWVIFGLPRHYFWFSSYHLSLYRKNYFFQSFLADIFGIWHFSSLICLALSILFFVISFGFSRYYHQAFNTIILVFSRTLWKVSNLFRLEKLSKLKLLSLN